MVKEYKVATGTMLEGLDIDIVAYCLTSAPMGPNSGI